MSESVGLRTHDPNSKSLVPVNELSPTTTDQIDQEIRKILQVTSGGFIYITSTCSILEVPVKYKNLIYFSQFRFY